jgi:hypothetical protein
VNLRVDGVVEEVVIDDFIPVHENGLPVFCQPNKSTGEFWVVLLEKALAKVNGGYSNLNGNALITQKVFPAMSSGQSPMPPASPWSSPRRVSKRRRSGTSSRNTPTTTTLSARLHRPR